MKPYTAHGAWMGKDVNFLVGVNHQFKYQQGSICFVQGVCVLVPFRIKFDLTPDGSIQIREVEVVENPNPYMHFAYEEREWDKRPQPTETQIKAFREGTLSFGEGFSTQVKPSGPVTEWALGKKEADFTRAMHS